MRSTCSSPAVTTTDCQMIWPLMVMVLVAELRPIQALLADPISASWGCVKISFCQQSITGGDPYQSLHNLHSGLQNSINGIIWVQCKNHIAHCLAGYKVKPKYSENVFCLLCGIIVDHVQHEVFINISDRCVIPIQQTGKIDNAAKGMGQLGHDLDMRIADQCRSFSQLVT